MTDALSLLREYIKKGGKLTWDPSSPSDIQFAGSKFARNTVTNFRSIKGSSDPYPLDACCFLFLSENKPIAEYYKECSQYGCTRVSAVDKNDLLEYLKGKREASAVVQLKADDELGTESVNEPPAKRQKLEDGSALTTKTSESELSHEPMELTASDWAAREEFSKRLDSKTREGDAGTKATLVNLAAETGLSLEKIEALKMKAKLKKKTPGDENTADKVLEDELRETPATANSYLTRSVAVVKDITSRERPMRTRASVLQLKGKEFKYILDTLHTLTKQQKTARPDAKKTIDFAKKPATQPTQPATRYDRYNFNEDASFWKEKLKGDEAEEFQIDTRGTFARDTTMAEASAPSAQSTNRPPSSAPVQNKPVSSTQNKTPVKTRKSTGPPIIIVPAALTTHLTLYNAQDFLEQGVFVSSIDKRNVQSKKPTSVQIKSFADKSTVYEVIDSAQKLKEQDWERVVAVFALGQQWQFKGWKWSEPVELFHHVRGFYLRFDDDGPVDAVKKWNMKVLTINRHKRHLDKTAVVEFWQEIDKYVSHSRPELLN
jgi:parafibromin